MNADVVAAAPAELAAEEAVPLAEEKTIAEEIMKEKEETETTQQQEQEQEQEEEKQAVLPSSASILPSSTATATSVLVDVPTIGLDSPMKIFPQFNMNAAVSSNDVEMADEEQQQSQEDVSSSGGNIEDEKRKKKFPVLRMLQSTRQSSPRSAKLQPNTKWDPSDLHVSTKRKSIDNGEQKTNTTPKAKVTITTPFKRPKSPVIFFKDEQRKGCLLLQTLKDKFHYINCVCGKAGESGTLLQCEQCFCWQHARCLEMEPLTANQEFYCSECMEENLEMINSGEPYVPSPLKEYYSELWGSAKPKKQKKVKEPKEPKPPKEKKQPGVKKEKKKKQLESNVETANSIGVLPKVCNRELDFESNVDSAVASSSNDIIPVPTAMTAIDTDNNNNNIIISDNNDN